MKGWRPLTSGEVQLIQKGFGGRYAARDRSLSVLGVKSGFRISELLSLQVRDVWQYGRVVDRVTVQRRYMKRKIEGRTVPLHADTQEMLAVWLRQRLASGILAPETFVFRSQKGGKHSISRGQAWGILHKRW